MIRRRTPITGNGRGEKPLFPGFESPAIAQNKLVASGRFVPFDVRSEISQGIARRRVGNLCVDQRKKSARQAKWRASSDDHLLTALSKATAL
jgi:hypothetical protein